MFLEAFGKKQVSVMQNSSLPMAGNLLNNDNFKPEHILRKGIYDKLAAQLILQQFLDIYSTMDVEIDPQQA